MDDLLKSICSLLVIDSPKDRERVNKLFAILNGAKVTIYKHDQEDRYGFLFTDSINNFNV